MSRIGKNPINVPEGVTVTLENNIITVKGPKGTLVRNLHANMKVTLKDNVITVERPNEMLENKAVHGTTRTLIDNMIIGVKEEFKKVLEVNGVGYRVAKKGNGLTLNLGYSHPVEIEGTEGISFTVEGNKIIVSGIDKEAVGQMSAVIRSKRPPEVYKGKGIKYDYEKIRRKEGKTGK